MTAHANEKKITVEDGSLVGDNGWVHSLFLSLSGEDPVSQKPKRASTKGQKYRLESMELALKRAYALSCGTCDNREAIKQIIREACPEVEWW